MKRFVVPIVSTLVLSAILVTVFLTIPLEPVLASEQGRPVDLMMRLLFALAAVIFSLVMSFMVYSIVVFRRRPGDTAEGTPIRGNTALEVVWTGIPVLIVLALGIYGATGVVSLHQPAAPDELVVDVTGAQWTWSFFYPGLNITSGELYLPVDRPVLFQIHSVDVIHSFWIPEFRIKMDAIPGIMNHLRITPNRVGDYQARCAELCGTAHAYMHAPVHVVEQAAFETWVQEQQAQAGGTVAQQGEKFALQFGCTSCHSVDGHAMVGPTFKGLYGSQVTLQDGTAVTADDTYLRNSIVMPAAQLVQGFPDVMPKDFGTRLTGEQIAALIEYIRSLR